MKYNCKGNGCGFMIWFKEMFKQIPYKDDKIDFNKLPANLQALTFNQALIDYHKDGCKKRMVKND